MGEAFPSQYGMDPVGPHPGRYKVNYNYAPHIGEFTDLVLQGCAIDTIENSVTSCSDTEGNAAHYNASAMLSEERMAMQGFRRDHVTYSYCRDRKRYPVPPPECGTYQSEVGRRYRADGSVRFSHGRRQGRGRSRHRWSPVNRREVSL